MRILRLITAIPGWIWDGIRRGNRRCEWCVHCDLNDAITGWCWRNKQVVNRKSDWCRRYIELDETRVLLELKVKK